MSFSDWDDAEFPLAYLITFRTYGTWLHGDKRGSVDLHGRNLYGTPFIESNPLLVRSMNKNLLGAPFLLNVEQRKCVEKAIQEACDYRSYALSAINVRTNHVHTVVSALARPERIATTFKSYATRRLRKDDLVLLSTRIWARGESTRYLWKENFVERAIEYVLYGQGDELTDALYPPRSIGTLPNGRVSALWAMVRKE